MSETRSLIDSETAAARIGVSRDNLYMWLSRRPEYRPAQAFGGAYLWTDEEIDRVIVARSQKPRRKVKA